MWRVGANALRETYAELTRLELFERLGMVHTCCFRRRRDITYWCGAVLSVPKEPDVQETMRLQDEDRFYATQLDMLMREYRSAREKYEGTLKAFLRRWWGVVDQILPEPNHRSQG